MIIPARKSNPCPSPRQNEFLLPFLQVLNDGKAYTWVEVRQHLIQHFAFSTAQPAEKSGNQNTLTSRLAWCDTHFVKAGFVEKTHHPTERTLDRFSITSAGVRELKYRPEKITVGYLAAPRHGWRGGFPDCPSPKGHVTATTVCGIPTLSWQDARSRVLQLGSINRVIDR